MDEDVFDAAMLLSQLGGMRDIGVLLVEAATAEIPEHFAELSSVVAAGDWSRAERLTHTLKSLLGQVGSVRLANRLQAADRHLREGGQLATAEVDAWQAEYALLAAALDDWLAEGK